MPKAETDEIASRNFDIIQVYAQLGIRRKPGWFPYMNPYQPFLIPLLGTSLSRCPPEASDPLDEERWINTHGQMDWEELARQCERAYGLPLWIDGPDQLQTAVAYAPEAGDGQARGLHVEWGEQRVFLIEHPQHLTLCDRFSYPYERLMLARPSLFNFLSGRIGKGSPDQVPDIECRDNITTFCAHYLGKRIEATRPSDLHLEARPDHYRMRERVDGCLLELDPLTSEVGLWWMNSLQRLAGLADRGTAAALEGSFELDVEDGPALPVRISLIPTLYGLSASMRVIYPEPDNLAGLESLGMSPFLSKLLNEIWKEEGGLWLACGPTGSGKSTTLHTLLKMAVAQSQKVVGVEDPVERRLTGVQQVSVGNPHGMSFALALRAFLRQAPDCLLVGEIRDRETAAGVLQAVRSGHRVLSTVHASGTKGVYRRFEDLGYPVAAWRNLNPVMIHQRLLPCSCRLCSRPVEPDTRQRRLLQDWGICDGISLARGPGCAACTEGRRGRLACFQVDHGDVRLGRPADEIRFHMEQGTFVPDAIFALMRHARFFTLSKAPVLN